MAQFSELIRSFDKIRDYMRDFYVYGFKSRGDFTQKSARTYDNEKRRIESYLSRYMQWSYSGGGKRTFISLDSSRIDENPLYNAWKSKTFTSGDIMLHFYLLDQLRDGEALGVEELTDRISLRSGQTFDSQTVRLKCREYAACGILTAEKEGRALRYRLSPLMPQHLPGGRRLRQAMHFFAEAAPFGEVGSFILDNWERRESPFRFKHHFIVHTLEDGVLLELLGAIRQGRVVQMQNHSPRAGTPITVTGVPLGVFVSVGTGRRYICLCHLPGRRFVNYRLDYIQSVEPREPHPEAVELREMLHSSLQRLWGVSFGGRSRRELLCMKLHIDEERESYVLERLHREGRGGEILRTAPNTFVYTRELLDTNEMSSWIKTFTGRIIALEGTNRAVVDKFYRDMNRMQSMYLEEAVAE